MMRNLLALMLLCGPATAQTLGLPDSSGSPCESTSDCNQAGAPECHLYICTSKGRCSLKPLPMNGTACDDGDPCTAGDQCMGGECGHTVELQNPACGAPAGALCEFSGTAGTVQECVVTVEGSLPTGISASLSMSTARAKMHGVFITKCFAEGCFVVPVQTTVEGQVLGTTLTDMGHFLFVVPFDLSNWKGMGAALAVHFWAPDTPVVSTPGNEFFRVQVVLTEDVGADDPVVLSAGPVGGADGNAASMPGSAGLGSLYFMGP